MLLRHFFDVTPETPILEGKSVYSLEPSNQQVSKMETGFLCHELYFWHHVGKAAVYVPAGGMVEPDEHCESPESKRRFRNLLEASGQLDHLVQLKPEPAEIEDILRFHTREYLDRVILTSNDSGGDVGDYAILPAGGYEIAMLAAGGAIQTTEAVIRGEVDNAYALVRPPGHHAEAERGRGFCIFGNLVLSAMKAQAAHAVGRIMTVDWDIHHGNGTQWAFYSNPDVLTISIHQDGLYPWDSGKMAETGDGPGAGYNINVPLPPGAGHGAYLAIIERVVLPAAEKYRPDLILVSSGFDSCALDPLGRMMCHSDTYREMTLLLMNCAASVCNGRIMLVHEGGYSPGYAPFCGLAVMEALSGIDSGHQDPFQPFLADYPGQELMPHQESVINDATVLAEKIS